MKDGYESDTPANRTEGKRLLSIVERIERLTEEIAELQADKREIMAEAKSDGFDTKALGLLIKERGEDPAKAQQLDMMVELYRRAIAESEKSDDSDDIALTIRTPDKEVSMTTGNLKKISKRLAKVAA